MAITAAQLDILFRTQGAARARGDVEGIGQSVSRAGAGFDRLKGTALGVGTALIFPMRAGLNEAVQLEQGIANINASLGGLDPTQLQRIEDEMRRVGTASQFSAVEASAVTDSLARAGFSVEQILGGATQAVVDLAQATGDGLDPALTGIVATMSTWNESIVGSELAVKDASRVADILTVAANQSAAGIGDINAGLRNLGPVAATIGIPFEDSAAAIALFTNYGIKGADAGVSLARGIQNLATPTAEASEWMDKLGISAFDMNGNFIGLPALFDQLQVGLKGLSDEQKQTAISSIFGAEALDVMMIAAQTGADPLEALVDLMGQTGVAAEQSALRMDTLGAQWETLKEGANTFLGSLVDGLIPGLRVFVDTGNAAIDMVDRIPPPIKTAIGAVAGLLAGVAAITRAVQAFTLVNGLLTGGAAGGAGIFGFGALVPVLLGVAAIAGTLYGAWRLNVGGMTRITDTLGDAWDDLTDIVDDSLDIFRDVWDSFESITKTTETAVGWWTTFTTTTETVTVSVNTLSRFLYALGAALWPIKNATGWEWIPTVQQGIKTLADTIQQITEGFTGLREQGFEPFQAALLTIGGTFEGLLPTMQDIYVLTTSIVDAILAFAGGDVSGGFDALGRAAGAAWDIVGRGLDLLRDITGEALGWVIDVGVPTVTGWLAEHKDDMWAGLKAAAGIFWTGLINLGTLTVAVADWAQGEIPDIWTWLEDTVFPTMGDGLATISDTALLAASHLDDVATSAQDFANAIERIPIIGPGVALAIGAVALAIRAVGLALDPVLPDMDSFNTKLGETETQANDSATSLEGIHGKFEAIPEPIRLALGSIRDAAVAMVTLGLGARLLLIPLRGLAAVLGPIAGAFGIGVAPAILIATGAVAAGLFTWRALERNLWGVHDASVPLWHALQDTADGLILLGTYAFLLGRVGWDKISSGIDKVGDAVQGLADGITIIQGTDYVGLFISLMVDIQIEINKLGHWFDAKKQQISDAWDKIWDADTWTIEGFSVSDYLPDISFDLDDIPGVPAAKTAAEEAWQLVSDPIGWAKDHIGGGGDGESSNSGKDRGKLEESGSIQGWLVGDALIPHKGGGSPKLFGDFSDPLGDLGQRVADGMATITNNIRAEVTNWTPPVTVAGTAMGTSLTTTLGGMLGSTITNFGAISSTTETSMAASATSVDTHTAGMSADMNTKLLGMQLGSAAKWLSIQQNATGQTQTMETNVVATFGDMGSAVSTRMNLTSLSISSAVSRWPGIVGSIRPSMYFAGADAIMGLVNGARSRLGYLQGVVNDAIAIFAQIPNLGNSPWPMMIDAGHDAMDGLISGVDDRMGTLDRSLSDVASLFGGQRFGDDLGDFPRRSERVHSASSTVTYNTYQILDARDFQRMLAAADGFEVLTSPAEHSAVNGGR